MRVSFDAMPFNTSQLCTPDWMNSPNQTNMAAGLDTFSYIAEKVSEVCF